jgi:thiamine transporter ThiT
LPWWSGVAVRGVVRWMVEMVVNGKVILVIAVVVVVVIVPYK